MTHCVDMFPAVDTRDLPAVQNEVESIFSALFPEANGGFIPAAFEWTEDWFTGRYPGYQAIDARYHDLEHTLQGTLGLARILRGRHFAGVRPILTPKAFELGLFAILMHDTGYLKRVEDTEGTGAKYTATHVRRSGEFARQFLSEKGYNASDIHSVQNMIRCTGVNVDLSTIPFTSELERMVGFALGTADLLGQMAATDYVEKLPVLYAEFAEAAAFAGCRLGEVDYLSQRGRFDAQHARFLAALRRARRSSATSAVFTAFSPIPIPMARTSTSTPSRRTSASFAN